MNFGMRDIPFGWISADVIAEALAEYGEEESDEWSAAEADEGTASCGLPS